MFGLRSFTGVSFVRKIGNFGVEFTAGLIEEVTLNITTPGAANAAEIPFPAKDQMMITVSLGVGSKIVESNVLGLIAGTRPNLLI